MPTIHTTRYGYSLRSPLPFSEAVPRVKEAFIAEGFGIISEINVREKMMEKLGKEVRDYVILGMCNPQLAYDALEVEPEIGLILPCNIIVYVDDDGTVIAAQQPKPMLGVIGNEALVAIAEAADMYIMQALKSLAGTGSR